MHMFAASKRARHYQAKKLSLLLQVKQGCEMIKLTFYIPCARCCKCMTSICALNIIIQWTCLCFNTNVCNVLGACDLLVRPFPRETHYTCGTLSSMLQLPSLIAQLLSSSTCGKVTVSVLHTYTFHLL